MRKIFSLSLTGAATKGVTGKMISVSWIPFSGKRDSRQKGI